FTAQEGTEAVLDGDNVVITYYPKNTTVYAGFYFGDIRYEDTRTDYQAAAEDGSYSITLSKDYCGKAWPVVPVKKSDGNTTSSQYYLAIPSEDKLQEEEEEEITDAKSYEVAVSSSGGSMYAAAEGINAYIAQQEDGTLAAKITTVNGKADMAAIGSRDEIIEHAVDWYKNEGDKDHSVFTIPIDSMNCLVTLYFRNATTGNWSSAGYTYTFSAETLKKASEEAVELGENIDPAEKDDETGDDDGKDDDSSEDPSEDPEKKDDQDPGQTDDQTPGKEDKDSDQQSAKTPLMILKSDGTEYGMLRVTEYSAVSDGENITITFFTTHETYALKLYLGTVDEISSISKAYTRAEDTSFTITVPYADKGSKLPLVIATSKGWKNEQYYIQIPDVVTETDEPVEEAPQEDDEDNTSYQPEETGDTNGTTAAVNNQTALADGVYTPDSFSFSGGTGKLTISCTQISVRNGKAYATLVFSSGNIIYVKASGGTYYPIAQTGSSSTYEIPVELNSNNQILACTTAMSQPHEVAYTIFIGLNAAKNVQDRKDGEEIKTEDGTALIFRTNAPKVPGLTYIGTLKTESAQFFRLHYYEDGFKVLQISLSDERPDWDMIAADLKNNSLREDTNTEEQAEEKSLYDTEVLQYLLMPADAEVPAGAEKEMIICVVPAEHAYIASKAVLEQLDEEELKAVAAVADADVINETLAQALEAGELKTAGTIENVDYKTLLLGGVDLAVVALKDLAATADENTEKQISDPGQALREQIVSCGDDMQLLEIALLIDRSEEETEEKGREEWNAVYHAFLRKQSDQ
ncbi:MAG: hypothetical protein IKG67_02955, partial [Parasporobacterium sp.]|nr:hypothetical protein [Parasporobacterium sp.]